MVADKLLARLEGLKQTGHGRWLARCPAHEDRRASLSVRQLDDGRVLVHDFAGCGVDEIVRAVGLKLIDLFPPKESKHYERQPRSGVHAMDALACLIQDVRIVKVAATDLRNGVEISPIDWNTLNEAVRRICSVEGVVRG